MIHRSILVCLALMAALSAGCMFSKKSSATKPTSTPAAETEVFLRDRWVEKRTAELVAQGQAAEAARTQALAEFRERYGFTGAAQK